MLYPMGRRDAFGFMSVRLTGNTALWRDRMPLGERYAVYSGETWRDTAANPTGYAARGAFTLPPVGGERASRIINEAVSSGIATGALGRNGEASADAVSSGTADGIAVFPGAATGAATASGTATGVGIAIGAATGTATSTGTAQGIATFDGSATGFATATGTVTPYAIAWGEASNVSQDLTEGSIAAAVWAYIQNGNTISTGEELTAALRAAKVAVALSA